MKKIIIIATVLILSSCLEWIMEDMDMSNDYVELEIRTSDIKYNLAHSFVCYYPNNNNNNYSLYYIGYLTHYGENALSIGCIGCFTSNPMDTTKICKTWKEYFDYLKTDSVTVIITKTKEDGYEWAESKNDSLLLYKKVLRSKEMESAPRCYYIEI